MSNRYEPTPVFAAGGVVRPEDLRLGPGPWLVVDSWMGAWLREVLPHE
jgi:hypothetical protein